MGKKGFKILFFVLVGAGLVGLAAWWAMRKGNTSGSPSGAGTSNGATTDRTGGKSTDGSTNDKTNGTVTGRGSATTGKAQ